MSEGLVQRRRIKKPAHENEEQGQTVDQKALGDSKEPRLTLMEELLLLGLKDKEGYTPFWNGCISSGLRGCVLIELALRGRIELEKASKCRMSLLKRRVLVKSAKGCGDVLLDESLKHMREASNTDPETVETWIEYLTYELMKVRERLAKNLTEKGVLTTEKQSFLLFDMTTYPLIDSTIKNELIRKVQDALLSKWVNDPHRMDKRLLSLIFIAHASEVLENALAPLNNDDYDLAMKHVQFLLNSNLDAEAGRQNANEVMWAVFAKYSYFNV